MAGSAIEIVLRQAAEDAACDRNEAWRRRRYPGNISIAQRRAYFVRGSFTLVFDYDGATYTSRGTYLHVLTRTPGTGWRISHRFWNDLDRKPA